MMRPILCIFLFATLWSQTPSPPVRSLHVTKFVAPAYSLKARTSRVQGETTSEVQIRADGTVDSVNVTKAHPFFREYVQSALKQWRFEPTGTTFTQEITVRFRLDVCDKDFPAGETRVQADLPQLVEVRTCLAVRVQYSKTD
jgi:TonB family protein